MQCPHTGKLQNWEGYDNEFAPVHPRLITSSSSHKTPTMCSDDAIQLVILSFTQNKCIQPERRTSFTRPVSIEKCENAEHTRSGLFHLSQNRSSIWSLHCKAVANYNSQIPFYNTVKQWRTLQKHALTSVDLPNTEFSLSSSFITEALLNSL